VEASISSLDTVLIETQVTRETDRIEFAFAEHRPDFDPGF